MRIDRSISIKRGPGVFAPAADLGGDISGGLSKLFVIVAATFADRARSRPPTDRAGRGKQEGAGPARRGGRGELHEAAEQAASARWWPCGLRESR